MISPRERGSFQLLVVLQIVAAQCLFWLLFFVLFKTVFSETPSTHHYGRYSIVVLIVMIFEAFGRPPALRLSAGRVKRLALPVSLRQTFWVVTAVSGLLVFSKDGIASRQFLGAFFVLLAGVLFALNRFTFQLLSNMFQRRSEELKIRTLVLGPKDWCDSIVPEINFQNGLLAMQEVVYAEEGREPSYYCDLVSKKPIDLLVVPARKLSEDAEIALMRLGDRLGYRTWLPVELTRTYGRHFTLQRAGRLDVLTPPEEPLENPLNQVIKRTFDLCLSTAVLVTLFPILCAVVYIGHRRQSPGPLFFKQPRVGQNGQPFEVYKFRSLHVENGDASKQVTIGDSRLFPFGAFLRKSSIDEIPQFLNVFSGKMSVVGPRPHMEEHDERFREYFENYGHRRYVKPGVTGMAQVKGYRGEINKPLDLRNRARLDNFYVMHWTPSLDIEIVFGTALAVIKPPKTAY